MGQPVRLANGAPGQKGVWLFVHHSLEVGHRDVPLHLIAHGGVVGHLDPQLPQVHLLLDWGPEEVHWGEEDFVRLDTLVNHLSTIQYIGCVTVRGQNGERRTHILGSEFGCGKDLAGGHGEEVVEGAGE